MTRPNRHINRLNHNGYGAVVHGAVPPADTPHQEANQVRGYGMGVAADTVQQPQPTSPSFGTNQRAAQGYSPQQPVNAAAAYAPAHANLGQYVAPATSQPQALKPKKHRACFWVGIIVAILCAALALFLVFTLMNNSGPSKRQGSIGQLEGKTDEEIQAELNRVVDEGMFNISIASTVEFPSGTSEGELRIENVPGNQYLMQVSITRDDNGQQIYESGVLEPNYHIQSDTLDVDLPAGTYPCTANFRALDPETEDEIGTAGAQLTIVVNS